MPLSHDTLSDRITAEISRVSARRERDLAAARAASDLGAKRPLLYLMDQAMHFAKAARAERCPVAMVACLRALEDFKG